MKKLSLVFGEAYEVHPNDEILESPNVRGYVMGHATYVGVDTSEVVHLCSDDCLHRYLPDEYCQCVDTDSYASIHTWTGKHGLMVRTADVGDFDPGNETHILCANCGTDLLKD